METLQKNYSAIISDAGDILFSTVKGLKRKQEVIEYLSHRFDSKIPIDESVKNFKYYNDLAQTSFELWESIFLFSKYELGEQIGYGDCKQLEDYIGAPNIKLFDGVVDTLEKLDYLGLPFIILTNGPKSGRFYDSCLDEVIKSELIEKKEFDKWSYNYGDYIFAQISSKDLGVRKPDEIMFQTAFNLVDSTDSPRNILYVAHTKSEINGALNFGFDVVNCGPENLDVSRDNLYEINRFSELLGIIT